MRNVSKIALASLVALFMLIGCGDSDKKREFEVSQDLDKGNYQSVIDKLGDCSDYSGKDKNKCLTNLGTAYFGLDKFDMISIGQELLLVDGDKKEKNKEFKKIISPKLRGKNTRRGLDIFTMILGENESKCSAYYMDTEDFDVDFKNACYSTNPIVLMESLEDDEDDGKPKSKVAINAKTFAEFTDVFQNAVPDLDDDDIVSIIADEQEDLGNEKDINGNSELDKLEATTCSIRAFNENNLSICEDKNITIEALKYNVFAEKLDANITSVKVSVYKDINDKQNNKNEFYRLIKKKNNGKFTIVSVDMEKKVDENMQEKNANVDGKTIFYKPKISNDGKAETFDKSITQTLNDENKFKQIAMVSDLEDEYDTEEQKVEELQKDICEGDPKDSSYAGDCIVENGKIVITEDAVLKYMNKGK